MHDARHTYIADTLREGFNVPQDWVALHADQDDGDVVAIALNMHAHEMGNVESGPKVSIYPTRVAHVYWREGNDTDNAGWYVALYDGTNDDVYDPRPSRVIRLGHNEHVAICAMNLLVQRIPEFAIEREVVAG